MAENYIDKIEVDGVERPIRDTSGSVRYDAAQSLSDAQKTQARGNINAAPGGFGLGGDAKQLTSDDDVNTIGASGWYAWVNNNVPTNAIAVTSLTIMRVDANNSGVKVQTLYGTTDGVEFIMQPIVARRMIYGSKIGAWEWVNPPMALGVEYRTTERYLGKPVYCKLVDCGAIVEGKVVDLGLNNPATIISVDAIVNSAPSPAFYEASGIGAYGNSYYVDYYNATPRTGSITFHIGSGQSQGYVKVKYTKTTD